jgi:hypothetical protein
MWRWTHVERVRQKEEKFDPCDLDPMVEKLDCGLRKKYSNTLIWSIFDVTMNGILFSNFHVKTYRDNKHKCYEIQRTYLLHFIYNLFFCGYIQSVSNWNIQMFDWVLTIVVWCPNCLGLDWLKNRKNFGGFKSLRIFHHLVHMNIIPMDFFS